MSVYTEAEHAIALADTLKWITRPPADPRGRYAYGLYQQRLKDYNEAFRYFMMAYADGIREAAFDIAECLQEKLPDDDCLAKCGGTADDYYRWAYDYYEPLVRSVQNSPSLIRDHPEAVFRAARMLRYGLGTAAEPDRAIALFQSLANAFPELTPDSFNIVCEYTAAGSGVSAPTEICKLPVGRAIYETALYELENRKLGPPELAKIRQLLKKAWDFHCEDALFYDYRHFCEDFSDYPYQDEIREQYSFRIGQYGRICDVHPSPKAYLRMIRLYEEGYPGDSPERRKDFALKALPYYKRLEKLSC